MKISYGITVSNELPEIKFLLDYLNKNLQPSISEIVILRDDKRKGSVDVAQFIDNFIQNKSNLPIKHVTFSFNHNFSEFKNKLYDISDGDWIFQIDADEYPMMGLMNDFLIRIIESSNSDVIFVPRFNIIRGLTVDMVKQYGWKLSCIECSFLAKKKRANEIPLKTKHLLMETNQFKGDYLYETDDIVEYYIPIVNFPDLQSRIYENSYKTRWQGQVHETVVSTDPKSDFHPSNYQHRLNSTIKKIKRSTAYDVDGKKVQRNIQDFCLVHEKTKNKQIKQNNYYKKIREDYV